MTATFRVLLTVDVVADRAAEFERQWLAGDSVVSEQDANRGHWLARSEQEDTRYYVVSDWVDERSFRAFERSQDHLRHRAEMKPYLAGGSMVTMLLVGGADRLVGARR